MPRLLLSDEELSDLVFMIISPNKAEEVIAAFFDVVPKECRLSSGLAYKALSYKDYQVVLSGIEHENGSMKSVNLNISRPSSFWGFLGDKKVIQLLQRSVRRRYGPMGIPGVMNWGGETSIVHEPNTCAHKLLNEKFDFIVLKFWRRFD